MTDICIIFDLDGTLVDSEGLCNQAFLDLLPQLDDTLPSLVDRYRGRKLAPILADLEQRLELKLPNGFERDYRQRVAELFAKDLKPVPGVVEMLVSTRLPKCVASSGPVSKIQQALQVSGLESYFGDCIFSAYEVGSWKPEPGLFHFAADAMGFPPKQCAVVEDSDVGIAAAVAAGMRPFQYLASDIPPYRAEDRVVFGNMVQLSPLLAEFANMA
ncbi:HAD-IA family hydrolase [Methylomonas methanica]|uniref:HAD-superfamily hydrolase, subfamily IA, variant 3 n=1 Tax=Methylomonas methanica (strain DSM 25384 / MC09) TaxID=857087 RepID=G0A6P9_METMM|nr:HAD-IA family hydrolase [Methylomonas methanica]AEG00520.1 HAD-superfamily hydrolase, subfamily IA, variant 3 [Methylomonas methanica MC09]